MDQDSAGCALRGHLKLLLFVGLLLSETQLLVNLKAYFPPYNLPYCTLAFFILCNSSPMQPQHISFQSSHAMHLEEVVRRGQFYSGTST